MKKIQKVFLLVGAFFISSLSCVHADVLDHWATNQITTNSFELRHIVYGNGVYVAVAEFGDGGEIYSSSDGFNWTLRFADPNSWGLTLNYSSGRFAGVGGFGTVDVSSDGTNWTSGSIPVQYIGSTELGYAITYGKSLYVAVGDTNGVGNILTSPDGSTWTYRGITGGAGGPIADVAYGGQRFVAIGNRDGVVYVSSGIQAGQNWSKGTVAGGNKISYANSVFFVPLNSGTNLLSADGVHWSQIATGLTNMTGRVSYSNNLYMAQCGVLYSGSYLATSTNGTNWVQCSRPLPNFWSNALDMPDFDRGVATDGFRLVAVGASNTVEFYGEYNSSVYISDPLACVRMTNNPSRAVALTGLVGRNYQIQSADVLGGSPLNWRTNTTLLLPASPFVWTDATATNSARFYRGVLLP